MFSFFQNFLLIFLICSCTFSSQSASASLRPLGPIRASRPFRIVIDPGHGGADEGTTAFDEEGNRITEKKVTLMLARQIKKQLERQGYSVYLTRDQDREISLPQRTALANELKAEVFISLHMNSTRGSGHFNPQAHPEGIETFILNHASDASSRRLAHLENTVISGQLKDTSNETAHQLDVARILKDLRLDANLAQSKKLACAVQNHLIAATSHLATTKKKIYRNRGVKQALFHVLIGADMPSILVEAGFLNHPRDRSIVLSKRGQKLISRAITSALRDYRIQKNSSKSLSSLFKCKIN